MAAYTAGELGSSYLQQIWKLRHYVLSLVGADLRSRYKRSFLGVGWSLIRPIAMTTVLCVVFYKIFQTDIQQFAPFLMSGLAVWQFIVESTIGGCNSFTQGAAYIRQRPIPLAIFPLRTVLGTGIHASIALGLTVVLAFIFNGFGNLPALIFLLPALMLLFLLAWALAVICGTMQAHFPDTQHLLEIVLQIFFYITPILYPPETILNRHRFAWIIRLNPMSYFIDAVRQPILYGRAPGLITYGVCCGVVVALGLVAALLLRKNEKSLVFWI
jgi:ABC-type polysaccharide/polyol phosphate export permease